MEWTWRWTVDGLWSMVYRLSSPQQHRSVRDLGLLLTIAQGAQPARDEHPYHRLAIGSRAADIVNRTGGFGGQFPGLGNDLIGQLFPG